MSDKVSLFKKIMNTIVYFISRMIAYAYFLIYFRFTYSGKKNVPNNNENGLIIVANHSSNIDPFIVGVAFNKQLKFLAKQSLFSGIIGRWIKKVGGIPVDRNDTSPSTLKTVLKVLKQGHTLVMFPEGTRNREGNIKPFKKGIGLIVHKSRATVVPAYIKNNQKITPKGKKFPRPVKIKVYYGKAVDFNGLIDEKSAEAYQKIADKIYNAIIDLKNNAHK